MAGVNPCHDDFLGKIRSDHSLTNPQLIQPSSRPLPQAEGGFQSKHFRYRYAYNQINAATAGTCMAPVTIAAEPGHAVAAESVELDRSRQRAATGSTARFFTAIRANVSLPRCTGGLGRVRSAEIRL
jgi:hypothetical protein